MSYRLLVSIVLVCALSGCSASGVALSDYEALEVGMSLSECEKVVGSPMAIETEQILLGSTVTVGYFGEEGHRIVVVLTDGRASNITQVGLD